MTWFSVDIEANGPAPGLFSMTSIGLVAVRGDLDETFYAEFQPLAGAGCLEEALAVGGMSMNYLAENGRDAGDVMPEIADMAPRYGRSVGGPRLQLEKRSIDAGKKVSQKSKRETPDDL